MTQIGTVAPGLGVGDSTNGRMVVTVIVRVIVLIVVTAIVIQ